jgi:hypothetical protein
MKKIIIGILLMSSLFSCKKTENIENQKIAYSSFGEKITADQAITSDELYSKFKDLKEGDTIDVKFNAKINSVCQKKGCWMRLQLPDKNEAFVKFKDYGFFMPLNAANSNVIVNGKAFVSIESVDDLKHYAKDAVKPDNYINAIVSPEVTYSVMADGVLIQK